MKATRSVRVWTLGTSLGVMLLALGGGCAAWLNEDWAHGPVRWTWLAKFTGYGALLCLGVSQWTSPASGVLALLRRPVDPAFRYHLRRDFGVAAAALALIHGCAMGPIYFSTHWLEAMVNLPWIRSGGAALLVLLILWATSYPSVVRRCRIKTWKSLHRLSFVAVGLILFHALSGPHAFIGTLLGFATAIGLSWGVRIGLWCWRRLKPLRKPQSLPLPRHAAGDPPPRSAVNQA